jgi:hypothetical protein
VVHFPCRDERNNPGKAESEYSPLVKVYEEENIGHGEHCSWHHVLFPFADGIDLIPLQSTSGMAPSSQDHYNTDVNHMHA